MRKFTVVVEKDHETAFELYTEAFRSIALTF